MIHKKKIACYKLIERECEDHGEFQWKFPAKYKATSEELKRFFDRISAAEPRERVPGLILCSRQRKWGKLTLAASFVGHPVKENDFGKIDTLLMSITCAKDCFETPHMTFPTGSDITRPSFEDNFKQSAALYRDLNILMNYHPFIIPIIGLLTNEAYTTSH